MIHNCAQGEGVIARCKVRARKKQKNGNLAAADLQRVTNKELSRTRARACAHGSPRAIYSRNKKKKSALCACVCVSVCRNST